MVGEEKKISTTFRCCCHGIKAGKRLSNNYSEVNSLNEEREKEGEREKGNDRTGGGGRNDRVVGPGRINVNLSPAAIRKLAEPLGG